MITAAAGADVHRLLDRILAHSSRYSEVILCSPFIDAYALERLERIAARMSVDGGLCRFLTQADAAQRLRDLGSRASVAVPRNLHAKVVLLIGRSNSESEAIIGSANLTKAGLRQNVELGVHVLASSEQGRRLVAAVRRALNAISRT